MDGEGDEWMDEAEVMSEVHVGSSVGVKSTMSVFSMSPLVSAVRRQHDYHRNEESPNLEGQEMRADKEYDHGEVKTDEHGDLILLRRRKNRATEQVPEEAIVIHHHLTSRLPEVGLQIWRGALLLSDFILHTMCTSKDFDHVTALELGAGTGLAGLVMAQVAPLVFITDRGVEILDNCSRNIFLNLRLLRNGDSTVRVRELDWQRPWPPGLVNAENFLPRQDGVSYQWTPADIKDAGEVTVLLAADVVYSTDLTTSLFNILEKLMPPESEKVLYLAVEKRYNFSLSDLDVVAHGYEHLRTFFDSDLSYNDRSCSTKVRVRRRYFYGKKMDVTAIPHYITNYERGEDLELWEIRHQSPGQRWS